jgi:hypothetical protein
MVPIIHGNLISNMGCWFIGGGMGGRPWVQPVSTRALEQHFAGAEVLNKEKVRMKFNKDTIVTIYGYEIVFYLRNMK